MMVRIRLAALKDIKPQEVVQRFLFGGACSLAAYEIAQRFGPVIGGLFLAFPAIFPASASLVEKHHRENVQAAGGDGVTEGRLAAAMDAAGAAIGCIGLMGFALVMWRELPLQPAGLVLAESLLAWVVLAAGFWLYRRRRIDSEPTVLPKV
ncbi:MAG TPA: DUF3147 family protein [Acidobacteriaceae bacterium]|jgi:hypothetical protein|nr:DUF3147 family protein [Acidobacteriaceae bacterium]